LGPSPYFNEVDENLGLRILLVQHALHVDAKTVLSHWQSIESWDVLLKAMRYLGATEDQIACFEEDNRRWSRGSVNIRLLLDRKNLLGIDYSKL
jgi:hypothetical protein